MASKKPTRLVVTTTPLNRQFVGNPVTINIEGDNHAPAPVADRSVHVQVQVVHYRGGIPFVDLVPLAAQPTLNGPADNDTTSQVKFTASAIFTPRFLGTHVVKVTAWNNRTNEKPKDGKDNTRTQVTFRAG